MKVKGLKCRLRRNLKAIALQSPEKTKGKAPIVMKGPGFFGFVTNIFVPVDTDSTDAFQKLFGFGISHSNTLINHSVSLHRLSYPGPKAHSSPEKHKENTVCFNGCRKSKLVHLEII